MDFNWELFESTDKTLIHLLNLDILTDVELYTNDQARIKIHQAFLISSGSKVFQNILKKNKANLKEIELKHADRDVLDILVEYLYKNSVKLEAITVWKVLHFANYYGINTLANECLTYLQNRINIYNCIKIYHSTLKCTHFIVNLTQTFLKTNFCKIVDNNLDFCTIDYEQLQIILDDDYLNTPSEIFVWQTILKWICFMANERSSYLLNLLKTVRYGRIDVNYIKSTILENVLVKSNEMVDKYVNDIIRDHKELADKPKDGFGLYADKQIKCIKPRIPNSIIMMFGGWKNGITTNSIEVFDCQTNKWFENFDSPIKRAYHGLEFWNNKVYIIGGTNGDYVKNTLYRYDVVRRTFKKLASMNHPRCYVSSATMAGQIYAMGGHSGEVRLDSCEKYEIESNSWKIIANMNVVRSDACATVHKGKIYIAGGLNPNSVENSVEVYDPKSNTWTLIEQMTTARTSFCLLTYQNKLFALGGNDGFERMSSVECYNFEAKEWTSNEEMNSRRSTFRAVVFNEEIYAIGGYDGISPINRVEKFCKTTKKWTEVEKIHEDRSGFAVINIDIAPYSKYFTFNGKS